MAARGDIRGSSPDPSVGAPYRRPDPPPSPPPSALTVGDRKTGLHVAAVLELEDSLPAAVLELEDSLRGLGRVLGVTRLGAFGGRRGGRLRRLGGGGLGRGWRRRGSF